MGGGGVGWAGKGWGGRGEGKGRINWETLLAYYFSSLKRREKELENKEHGGAGV